MTVVSEITLTQRFSTISRAPEQYKITLTTRWKFRFYTFEGSQWAKDTECYKATEFWCFVIQRWLEHKMTTEDLKLVLGTVKASIPHRKTTNKSPTSNLVLLRNRHDIVKEKSGNEEEKKEESEKKE